MTWHYVSLGYFDALCIPVLKGRLFNSRIGRVLTRAFSAARSRGLFPRGDAIGQQLEFGTKPFEIVGVVPDVKNNGLIAALRDAFQDPNSFNFSYGDGPRISNLRGPRFKNQDIGFIKNLMLRERLGLRFQAEFFNAWNQHIFVCETRCFGTTAFDTDQLALKLIF